MMSRIGRWRCRWVNDLGEPEGPHVRRLYRNVRMAEPGAWSSDLREAACVTMRICIAYCSGASCWRCRPDTIAPTAAPAPGRLATCGRALCAPDGSRFSWRGVTAFGLVDLVADDREADARGLHRLGGPDRVHRGQSAGDESRMDGPLPRRRPAGAAPHAGAGARAWTLRAGRRPGRNGQRRSSAATRSCASRCARSRRLCAAADNCVLELANEPYHSSQAALNDAARMRRLQRDVPSDVPVAWGAARDHRSDDMAGGTYVVAHVARRGDRWDRVSRVQELGDLSRRTASSSSTASPSARPNRRSRRGVTASLARFSRRVCSRASSTSARRFIARIACWRACPGRCNNGAPRP